MYFLAMNQLTRRDFIGKLALTGSAIAMEPALPASSAEPVMIPPHLKKYADLFRQDPRRASLQWFQEAKFGMMPCFYLASLDGRHSFEQWKFKIPVAEYEKKMQRFTAGKFDANFIADLAMEAGMKYIILVTKHCEGFCLWDTKFTDFNSVKSAAKRDLVAEMVTACNQRGLGFFAFYEHGFDWHHPHGPRSKDFSNRLTEVAYATPEPRYAHGKDYDLNKYLDYASDQIAELLTNYGPIAGVWLDGVSVPLSAKDPSVFRCQELYDRIHKLQPHALISYKHGVTGTEDFKAPEAAQLHFTKLGKDDKPVELCEALNRSWSYVKGEKHRKADWVWQRMGFCGEHGLNYLLGVGNLPDGSVAPEDVQTLRELGSRLRARGHPKGQ